MVKVLGKENDIDKAYYTNLVNEAIEAISKYGDFEWFTSDDNENNVYPWFSSVNPEDLPWKTACGRNTCYGCHSLDNNAKCANGYDNSDFASTVNPDVEQFDVR